MPLSLLNERLGEFSLWLEYLPIWEQNFGLSLWG